jgi:hypothetical protein
MDVARDKAPAEAVPLESAAPSRGVARSKGWMRRPIPLRSAVEMAAALLVAFALGLTVGSTGQPPDPARGVNPRATRNAGPQTRGELLATESSTPQAITSAPVSQLADEVTTDAVPILVGAGVDEQWLRRQPPALPKSLKRQWERQGYRVEQRRRLVSMDLDGGQSVSIPVDEVELHYVGTRAY